MADLPTSGGASRLATSVPPDDAFQVRRLREAGAIILAQDEHARAGPGYHHPELDRRADTQPVRPHAESGWFERRHGRREAASFAAVGMGSDTCGSIRIPSAHHALVGLRGTRGLASGDGIIPLSTTQDIGGPLARSGPGSGDYSRRDGRGRIRRMRRPDAARAGSCVLRRCPRSTGAPGRPGRAARGTIG